MNPWEKLKSYLSGTSRSDLVKSFDTSERRGWFVGKIINNMLENPDQTLDRYGSGQGVQLYRTMEATDPVIASALATRRAAVVNRSFNIAPNGAEAKIVDYVHETIRSIDDFSNVIEQAMGALTTGFVPLEIFWIPGDGKWWIDRIIVRDPEDYVFDDQGNLRLLTTDEPIQGQDVPPLKFMVHRQGFTASNPYGRSVLQPLYWAMTFSRAGWKWWAWAVEKYGMPIITASFPQNASSQQRTDFKRFVSSLQAHAWAAVPEGFGIDLHEARRPSAEDYLPFLEYADTKKFQVILGQNLTAEVSRTGSRAQAVVHNQVRHDIAQADCTQLANTINNQLIKPAVMLNFNYDGPMPLFQIPCKAPEDKEKLARTYAILAKQIPIGVDHIRSTFDIPPLKPNEQQVYNPASN